MTDAQCDGTCMDSFADTGLWHKLFASHLKVLKEDDFPREPRAATQRWNPAGSDNDCTILRSGQSLVRLLILNSS